MPERYIFSVAEPGGTRRTAPASHCRVLGLGGDWGGCGVGPRGPAGRRTARQHRPGHGHGDPSLGAVSAAADPGECGTLRRSGARPLRAHRDGGPPPEGASQVAEYRALYTAAGFALTQVIPTQSRMSIIV